MVFIFYPHRNHTPMNIGVQLRKTTEWHTYTLQMVTCPKSAKCLIYSPSHEKVGATHKPIINCSLCKLWKVAWRSDRESTRRWLCNKWWYQLHERRGYSWPFHEPYICGFHYDWMTRNKYRNIIQIFNSVVQYWEYAHNECGEEFWNIMWNIISPTWHCHEYE